MTVKELIEALEFMPSSATVKFVYDYGDHWHTQVAANINEVDEGLVKRSEYHRLDKVVEDDGMAVVLLTT
jgi:hypothetical protein